MTIETPCSNETCTTPAAILSPVSLCTPCAIATALAVLPTALANALSAARETGVDGETETGETPAITPTDRERTAITGLRVTGTPIGRRSVARAVRALGGTCSTDRANALAAWARNGGDLTEHSTP